MGKVKEGDRSEARQEMEVEGDQVATKWEDTLCPICLETPHNASLLICSSRQNGFPCKAVLCDTSYNTSLNIFLHGEEFQVGHFRCPLCREEILSVERLESEAQLLLNSKPRPCPHGCDFMGSYHDIDDHVATMHSLRSIQPQPEHAQGDEVELDFDAEQLHDIEHIMIPLLFRSLEL